MPFVSIKAAGAAGLAGLAALAMAAPAGATAAPAKATGRASVAIHSTSAHRIAAPSTLRPGRVHLRNTGGRDIFIVAPRHGAGPKQLAADLNSVSSRPMMRDFVIADLLPGNEDAYLWLHRGTTYLVDADRDSYTAGAVTTVHVTGRWVSTGAPRGTWVGVSKLGKISVRSTIARNSYLLVNNASWHVQELILVPVGAKVSNAAVQAFVAHPSLDKLFDIDTSFAFNPVAMLTSGRSVDAHYRIGAGRHLLLTFTFNGAASVPELRAGQVRLVTAR